MAESFSAIDALKSLGVGTSGSTAQSSALEIQRRQLELRRQIELVKKSDTLSETDRTTRTNLLASRSGNENSIAALKTLTEKLNTVRTSAQGIRGGAGFIGFRFKTGDSSVVTGDAAKGTAVGDYSVIVDQLATATSKASGTITDANGNATQFTSDAVGSNTVTFGSGSLKGLTLNLQSVSKTVTTSTTNVNLTSLGTVTADKNNDKLSGTTASSLQDLQEVRLNGSVKLSVNGKSIDPSTTSVFVGRQGNAIRLFDTLEHAQKAGQGNTGRIDIETDGTFDLSKVTRTTTTTTTKQAVTVTVGRSKEDAIEAASSFFGSVSDTLNFLDTATSSGGALNGDSSVSGVASGLRAAILQGFTAFGSSIKSKGKSNAVSLDLDELSKSLESEENFKAVENVFRNGNGIASKVESFAAPLANFGGTLSTRISGLNRDSVNIDRQLSDLQAKGEEKREKLLDSLSSIASSLTSVGRQSGFISKVGRDKTDSSTGSSGSFSSSSTTLKGLNFSGISSSALKAARERFATAEKSS